MSGEMQELINRAKRENKMIWCRYQDLWFTPEELQYEQEINERFRWGPSNWELRDPQEKVKRLEEEIKRANSTLENFKQRIPK